MKLYDMLDCLGTDTKPQIMTEAKQLEDGSFEFSKYSGDKRHNANYNEYSMNANSVIPHGLIDIIKVKNAGLLGEHERGGQSSFSGLNGNIKRYFKKLSSLTKGTGDLGWDGGNVSKAMSNLLHDAVTKYTKNGEYLTPFKWDRLIKEYASLIDRYVDGGKLGAIPTTAKAKLPTGEQGVSMSEYIAYQIVTELIGKQFLMKRPLNTEEEVNNYKSRVEKLGFLSDVDDTGDFKGMYDAEAEEAPANPPKALDPFRI